MKVEIKSMNMRDLEMQAMVDMSVSPISARTLRACQHDDVNAVRKFAEINGYTIREDDWIVRVRLWLLDDSGLETRDLALSGFSLDITDPETSDKKNIRFEPGDIVGALLMPVEMVKSMVEGERRTFTYKFTKMIGESGTPDNSEANVTLHLDVRATNLAHCTCDAGNGRFEAVLLETLARGLEVRDRLESMHSSFRI